MLDYCKFTLCSKKTYFPGLCNCLNKILFIIDIGSIEFQDYCPFDGASPSWNLACWGALGNVHQLYSVCVIAGKCDEAKCGMFPFYVNWDSEFVSE